MLRLSRLALPGSLLAISSFLSPNIAVALEESNLDIPTELPSQTKVEAKQEQKLALNTPSAPSTEAAAVQEQQQQAPASETFVSQGQPIQLEMLGVSITPIKGWEVSTNTGTLSVVMREPRDPNPAYDHAKYQRNITVAAIHKASPIDEKRAAELKEEMIKSFSADSLVSNFQILEHKFFNYKGQNDGLIVYSSLMIGEYQMQQMHVLVSGEQKQFLMSYTDLAENFQQPASFEAAWNSMVSIEVTGASPLRIDQYARYGALAGGFLMLVMVALLLRRRAGKKDYASEADEFMEDSGDASTSMFATLADGWKIGGDAAEEISGIEFTGHASRHVSRIAKSNISRHAPVTRKTEYVSNY